jgi:hypothetical protein
MQQSYINQMKLAKKISWASSRSSTFHRDYYYEVGKNVLKFGDDNANKGIA